MIENRKLTLDDYLALLRRRSKIILIPTLAAPLAAFLISYAFTPKYKSQALVLVQGQRVPEGYVQSVVTEDLAQRVVTIEKKVLSRDRLQPMIERLGLAKSGKELDEAVGDIQRNTNVQPVITDLSLAAGDKRKKPGQPGSSVPAFYVAYTARSPRLAQQICAELTSMLLQEDLKSRPPLAQDTNQLLSRQLEEAKRNLDDQASKMATFKKQYMGQLQGDADNDAKLLAALNSKLILTMRGMNRAQQDKAYTESLLAQQLAGWRASQMASEPKNKLADVNSASGQDSSRDSKSAANEPPAIRQLRLQVRQYQEDIVQASREQKRLQDEIKVYQGRVAPSPAVEEQYKQLTRDYDTAQKSYQDLLTKRSGSEMATYIEHQEEGEQMTLLDPANLPDDPSFPNRPLFAVSGLAGGLVMGLGLALWKEMRDKAIRTEQDVEAALDLPALVSIPWVGSAIGVENDKRLWNRSSSGNAEKKENDTVEV